VRRSPLVGELAAEFLGTMILILFGVGVVAQVVTTPDGSLGDHDSISWAWGLGVTLGIYTAARLSGAHLNPAVTIALAAFKGFEWKKVAPYCAAQTLGAFTAAMIVRFVYADLIKAVDPNLTKTQTIFSTLPGNGTPDTPVSITTTFFDQIVGTAILVFVVFALTTASNNPPLGNIGPLMVGLLVVGIGMAWGANAGYAINPARDFGPRFATWITGYETAWSVPQTGYPYWWVPIVAPIVGGLIGGALFKFAIEMHIPEDESTEDPVVSEPTT